MASACSRAAILHAPEALRIALVSAPDEAVELDYRPPHAGIIIRLVAKPSERSRLVGLVGEGVKLLTLVDEQRELVRKLSLDQSKLQRRETLLDVVVKERTKELEESYEKLKIANRQALFGLAEAIEAKDPYTKGHCGRVAAYSLVLAKEAGYPVDGLETLEFGAFLHDIGKIGIKDAVLLKPGPLDDAEWVHMREHPVKGYDIASKIEMLHPIMPAVRNHHERWDGSGYPDKMVAETIPLVGAHRRDRRRVRRDGDRSSVQEGALPRGVRGDPAQDRRQDVRPGPDRGVRRPPPRHALSREVRRPAVRRRPRGIIDVMNRSALVMVLIAPLAVRADKKIQGMTPGFEREATTCAVQISGLKKVQTGSANLAPTLSPEDKAALDADLATLAKGLAGVEAYCAEVTDLVTFLKASATASYKSVEKELDTRDNKVRKLRKASKATIESLQPITRRWIGRIAQAQTTKPDVVEKKRPARFPSGRSVELPATLTGAWKVSGNATGDTLDYADKAWSATVFVRTFTGATCEQQQKSRGTIAKPSGDPLKREGMDIAWHGIVTTIGAKVHTEVACVRSSTDGGWLGTIEMRPAANEKLADLRGLMLAMVAAHAVPPTSP